jgi:uncharacterized protein YgiM (DUF1202 family)
MKRKLGLLLWLSAVLATPALALDGVMLRDDSMYKAASAASGTVGTAAKGSKVAILARSGGWTQIRAAGKTGWVRLLSVRGGTQTGADSAGLSDVAALGQSRDPTKVVSVAGMRGLTEEDLRKAQYDADQMRRLERLAVTSGDAQRFAAEGALVRQQIAYLPTPKTTSSSQNTPSGGFEF